MSEVTHMSPLPERAVTPCCGLTPFELPRTDRMTNDATLVTCGTRKEYATGIKRFTTYLHGSDDDIRERLERAFSEAGFKIDPWVLAKIEDGPNPFYEVAVSCEVDAGTGEIRLLGLVK